VSSESEYVTDVGYARHFDEDLSPSRLRLAAALNGFPTPSADTFDYCELGCAHGDTMNVLAAANPRARFVGVDFNAEHIASAKLSADGGALENVRFLERDFEALRADDFPELDFVVAHGVLSWVGPEKRRAILDFVSSRLKPGGLFYVSYNAMPGWAAVEPLRQLLVSRTLGVAGDTSERARQAVAFAKQMHDAGAAYFVQNPAAKEMLATMEALGGEYVAHEYLNAHWAPMYFAHVAWEMTTADLHFVGQLPLFLNYRDLAVPPLVRTLFEKVVDRATYESLKDYAINEFFRRDVYVKGRPGRNAALTNAYLDETPFGLSAPPPDDREVALPHAKLRLVGPVFDALFGALARGGTSVNELASRPDLAAFGRDRLRASLLRAVLAGWVIPLLAETHTEVAPDSAVRVDIPSPYNRMVLQRAGASAQPLVLASPASGTGVPITTIEALAIRVLSEVPMTNRADAVRALFGEKVRMSVGGRSIEDKDEQVRIVLDEIEAFRRWKLAKLIELRVLQA